MEAALQNGRLTPRDRLDRRVGYPISRRRKRNLPEHADRSRQNLGLIETGKPQAQIKRIAHGCILNRSRVGFGGEGASASGFDAGKTPCYYGLRRQNHHLTQKRPRRLAWPRTSPFHGGNTGSNPVGDANLINHLLVRDRPVCLSQMPVCSDVVAGIDKRKESVFRCDHPQQFII